MDLAEKVRSRRIELGLSQDELARRMGYESRSSINKIEKGRPCSQKVIARLADALGVGVAYLMGWDEPMQADPAGLAEKHLEILTDAEFVEMHEDFKKLNKQNRRIVRDLVHNLASGSLNAPE